MGQSLRGRKDREISENIDQRRLGTGNQTFREWVGVKGKPTVHDFPQRRSIKSFQDTRRTHMMHSSSYDMGKGCNQKTDQLLDEEGDAADYITNANGAVTGWRWRLTDTVPITIDLPRPNVGYQKKHEDNIICLDSHKDEGEQAANRRNSTGTFSLVKMKREGRKTEPVPINLPRRRIFYAPTTVLINVLPSEEITSCADGERGGVRHVGLTGSPSVKAVRSSTSGNHLLPEETLTGNVDENNTSIDNVAHGARHVMSRVRKALESEPIPEDLPRRRSFILPGTASERTPRVTSRYFEVSNAHQDKDGNSKDHGKGAKVMAACSNGHGVGVSMTTSDSFQGMHNTISATVLDRSQRTAENRRQRYIDSTSPSDVLGLEEPVSQENDI